MFEIGYSRKELREKKKKKKKEKKERKKERNVHAPLEGLWLPDTLPSSANFKIQTFPQPKHWKSRIPKPWKFGPPTLGFLKILHPNYLHHVKGFGNPDFIPINPFFKKN